MDSFTADAQPTQDIDLGDVRAKIRALQDAHAANGIALSGRVIHVCHYLPVTATLASAPAAPADKDKGGARWRLAPRIGHSAMVSGIRSISATHEQVIVGWTGDLYAPAPAPATPTSPPAIVPSGADKDAGQPGPDYSAQTTGVLPPPAILPAESVGEADRAALAEQVYKYEDDAGLGAEGSAYDVGENEEKVEGAKPIRLVPVWLDDQVAHGHYEGYCKTSELCFLLPLALFSLERLRLFWTSGLVSVRPRDRQLSAGFHPPSYLVESFPSRSAQATFPPFTSWIHF